MRVFGIDPVRSDRFVARLSTQATVLGPAGALLFAALGVLVAGEASANGS